MCLKQAKGIHCERALIVTAIDFQSMTSLINSKNILPFYAKYGKYYVCI